MSILDDMIAVARRKQQDEQRKNLDKQAKKVCRIIGKDLYNLLNITHNEYEGVLQFTVRGERFYLTNPMVGFGVTVTVAADWHRSHGRSRHAFDANELLVFIDENTKKGA